MKFCFSFLVSIFLFVSCGDPCDDVNCDNGGSCDDGTCICLTGYTGDNCQTEIRSSYYGTWDVVYSCDNDPVDVQQGEAIITADPDDILGICILLDEVPVKASIDDNGLLTVPSQMIEDYLDEGEFSGNGVLLSETGTINLIVNSDGETYACMFSLSR